MAVNAPAKEFQTYIQQLSGGKLEQGQELGEDTSDDWAKLASFLSKK